MAGNKFSHKRGAPGDDSGHNPINSRPAQEYIVIVGGPTNTFNAWWSYVDLRAGSGSNGFWAAQPAPRTLQEIDYYIVTPPSPVDPAKAADPAEWQRRGWSQQAIDELNQRAWKSSDIYAWGPETHDRYWANFVDSAIRLYFHKDAFAPPLKRPTPQRGDIVTYLIYAPSYEKRQKLDYDASPYNPDHRNKPGIYGNPTYDATAPRGPQPTIELPHITYTVQDEIRMKEERRRRAIERAKFKERFLPETELNHYILMRTTSENTEKVIKRATSNYCYFDYLEQIPSYAVQYNDVMTKVLFFSHPDQVMTYLRTGSWIGEPIVRDISESDAEDYAEQEDKNEQRYADERQLIQDIYDFDAGKGRYGLKNFIYSPPQPVKRDVYGRPLKWTMYWSKLWNDVPQVNRTKIKIGRLDYFGHSASSTMMLQWGWKNLKGQIPEVDKSDSGSELALHPEDFESALADRPLTADAQACLWGCHLGKAFGPRLAPFFRGGVVGAETLTDFEKIIHNDTNMPEPVGGEPWHEYMSAPAAVHH
ncbi:MAG TPA: hypothetical protein VGM03_13370 [Phycisphaerae bacterium]|jgi:hypothetical protein